MTHAPWRLPVAFAVAAALMLAVAVRWMGDCSGLGSDTREVGIGALLIGSGAAFALSASWAAVAAFRHPAVAGGIGVLAAVAFGASFSLYALATGLGDCPS